MNQTEEVLLKNLLTKHYLKYPLSETIDFLKLIYQNEFGAEHMAPDEPDSYKIITDELDKIPLAPNDNDYYDNIGNGYSRLFLRTIQEESLTTITLNRFFIYTTAHSKGNTKGFEEKVDVFYRMCLSKTLPYPPEDIKFELEKIRKSGYMAVSHSKRYKEAYTPAYRVVRNEFCRFLPLFFRIDEMLKENENIIIAIDGNSCSGKSTLADLVSAIYSCNVFHTDDFFLRPIQRTKERLSEPGGNVDYERFFKEITNILRTGDPVTYSPYNCEKEELSKPISVSPRLIEIVEGVYSMHPLLDSVYTLRVFLSIDEELQKQRLRERNPELYDRFISEWIPMENKYFGFFGIKDKCDLVFHID